MLQKTLAYPICIAKERRRRKNAADRKKGVVREIPSAVFRGVSYLLHPGHEYELGPESQRDRSISSMLAPWATVSLCCSGSSHCSTLCNYTVYNPPPALLFLRERYSSPFVPCTFLFLDDVSSCCFNVRLAGRGPAGGEGCARTAVFEYLFCHLPRILDTVNMSIFLLASQ